MSAKTEKINNILLTFFIGFVAGIAPFLFMDLLPNLLNTGVTSRGPNYPAILVTGILIGLITSIMFAKNFKTKEPHDIFFYALGIPAILIATVTNMNTNYSAKKTVDDTRASASMDVLEKNVVPEIKSLTPIKIPIIDGKTNSLDLFEFTRKAYAEGQATPTKEPPVKNFVVTVGEYTDKDAALAAYRALLSNKLNTEKYISKKPKLLQADDKTYALIYSDHADMDEAIKTYKLLKINDPEYNVQLLRAGK